MSIDRTNERVTQLDGVGPDRFRLNPPSIAERLGEDYTPERIVEMIQDVEKRQQLAHEILHNIPEASAQYRDAEALTRRLDLMAEILPQKKSFFESVKDKVSWALDKVTGIFDSPVVKPVVVALLAWWAWGHIHELLASAEGVAAGASVEGMKGLDTAPGAARPGMGPGMETPGGGGIAPGDPSDFRIKPDPPMPPYDDPAVT